VSSGEDRVLFSLYSMRSMVLTMPCGRDVSRWVGGLDVKANFVSKIDIVGLVLVALLDGRELS
jgi:hypothetical protein